LASSSGMQDTAGELMGEKQLLKSTLALLQWVVGMAKLPQG